MSRHVRIYLPLTAEQVRLLHRDRGLQGRFTGFAVTDDVRGSDPSGDQESWEYAALQDAAAAAASAGGPVIVAAVDLDVDQLDQGPPAGSAVQVDGAVPLPRVAAFHLGDDVLSGGPPGPPSPDREIELSWYDTTELASLVSLV